ncbi:MULTISPECIES: MarR family winged helix-turn-helix transcriptional regulator [Enterococcus]|uniref:MarR family winged helix-turn-helix transcriptional regulator n=1 Tax=Enterococcus TaxID=1350 RepID=UPI0006B186A1|nr:MarR family transcriptional regulator [Enterococcus hirae]AND72528.1 MarR family transcriptional regulator [Enterococcus hirae]EMF0258649.1 MarR family transcriptional regulator [Enterococcus hirae]MBE8786190.1 MarR family transcriptional regulator [Enterococcus hirae]MBE8804695.1 MarR family transcriptional regulator [Enterococcus hirae]NBA38566.1 MarR family transcriptional regulator [Enterococcus hirae]
MEDLYLENQLCFPLYATSKEIIRSYNPLLKPLDLTYTQYLVMLVLWENQQVTMKELGSLLCLDSGTLTPVIKKMADKGLLQRRRADKDERITILSLTFNGKALEEKAKDIPAKILASLPLEPDELVLLQKLSKKMLTNFREKH